VEEFLFVFVMYTSLHFQLILFYVEMVANSEVNVYREVQSRSTSGVSAGYVLMVPELWLAGRSMT